MMIIIRTIKWSMFFVQFFGGGGGEVSLLTQHMFGFVCLFVYTFIAYLKVGR